MYQTELTIGLLIWCRDSVPRLWLRGYIDIGIKRFVAKFRGGN